MNANDVGFVPAIVEAMALEARIDRGRLYTTGLSNGGYMSHRLAYEAGG